MSEILTESRRKQLLESYFQTRLETVLDQPGQILPRDPATIAPLTYAQQQLWLHSQLAPHSALYNEPFTVRHRGALDVRTLEGAFKEIIRRHEAWRTVFPVIDGEPIQRVLPPFEVKLAEIDLRSLHPDEREKESIRLATADARQPFDLEIGPLFRAKLVRLTDDEQRLYVTLHHLIFDGFSGYRVFLPELVALYNAFSKNEPSPLPDLPFQLADYALWQRGQMEGSTYDSDLHYWRRRLAGPLPSLNLPVAHAAPPVQSFAGAMHSMLLPQSLSESLRELCQHEGVTLFMALLAAFKVLLYRYSGQEDILVGSNTAGRHYPGTENLLGYFLNTIPLRTNLSGDPTFRELLERGRALTLEALSHDAVPLDRLVAELCTERDPHRNPLFQILFSLEPPLATVSAEWDLTCIEVETGATKFELCMVIDDRREGLLCRLIYNTALFDAEMIARMAGHWQTLLESIVHDPTQRISEYPLLTRPERDQLVVEWNRTTTSYAAVTVQEQIFDQAKLTPARVAVRCGNRELSYQQLAGQAAQLAHKLRKMGVGPNALVALCLNRSPEMVVAILAALEAGGAYVPIDPANPRQRIEFILEDCNPRALLTQRDGISLPQKLPALFVETGFGETVVSEAIDSLAPTIADSTAKLNNLAYILYTSGSTGVPKGVQVTHRNLAYSNHARASYYKDSPENFLLLSSYAFDSSVAGIFHTLTTGGTLVIPPADFRWESEQLANLIFENKITHTLAVPSLYSEILDAANPKYLASLRSVIVAGEACPRLLVNLHYEILPQASLFNEYGPTEATVWSTVFECEPSQVDAVPIGRPIANTQTYILDRHLQPVPIGTPGELYIGGEGVARGYINQPALDENCFIPDLFSLDPGRRLYRTGDLARYLPTGDIEFLGRSDQQLKIRGQRVEPDEIELILSQHNSVREAAVVSTGDKSENALLIAFVALHPGPTVSASELRAFLRNCLPAYMIPSYVRFLGSLPRTANGKIDRRKLTAAENLPPRNRETTAPRNDFETRLLAIWQDVLKISSDDVNADFFELGGHSLLAAKLLARIEKEFHTTLSLAFIFQSPTLAQMAEALRVSRRSLRDRAVIPIQPIGTQPPLFWIRGGPRFRLLAQKLGSKRPFLGVDLPYADGVKLPVPHRLEDIAAYLLKAIREEQPEGPYYLAGLCVNAVIAYEVAQQLVRDGQTVALLAMVDAHNHAYYKNPFKDGRYTARIKYHLANLIRMDANETTTYLRERLEEARRKIERITWRLTADRKDRGDDFKNTDSIIHPAFSQYEPKPYPGKIVLLQSSEWPQSPYFEFRLGWEALVGAMDFRRIQGDHAYLFDEPCVDVLAAVVQEYLRG
jgi:surfactin family lipopeptide synthetase A